MKTQNIFLVHSRSKTYAWNDFFFSAVKLLTPEEERRLWSCQCEVLELE